MSDNGQQFKTHGGTRNAYPLYSPRFWHGMRLGSWVRLLVRNRFRIHPWRIPMAMAVTGCATINSTLAWGQTLVYGRRIRKVTIKHPPIFVIGHWRSGTTHLHELLSLDDRFTSPTTYECFAPEHFLITSHFLPPLLGCLLPPKRPMDDVAMGFDRPQEDEIALCTMGAPSPMVRMAFPNHPPPFLETLDLDEADPLIRQQWRQALLRFVRSVTLTRPEKRLVLKSPPHTGRVAYLAEMFPGAKFVHLIRDPRAIFGSSMRLWQTLDYDQGLQIPRHEHLKEFVFDACQRMYRGFERQKMQLAPGTLHELRYEDLVQHPVDEMQRLYEALDLGEFERARYRIEEYLRGKREYRASRYEFEPELEDEIRRRWAFYFKNYGYDSTPQLTSI